MVQRTSLNEVWRPLLSAHLGVLATAASVGVGGMDRLGVGALVLGGLLLFGGGGGTI